jgi:hypothetical protein
MQESQKARKTLLGFLHVAGASGTRPHIFRRCQRGSGRRLKLDFFFGLCRSPVPSGLLLALRKS